MQLSELPRELFHCHGLQTLSLSDNELKSLPTAFSALTALRTLDVSKNSGSTGVTNTIYCIQDNNYDIVVCNNYDIVDCNNYDIVDCNNYDIVDYNNYDIVVCNNYDIVVYNNYDIVV